MKRILSVLSVLLLTLVLFACQGKVDGAEQKLETAYTRMDALFADPSNITANFVMPGALADGVKAEWSSDQPGVISFVIGADGTVTGTVNRPNMGDGDVKVKVTAILSLKSELSDEMLTKEWSIELTVKENTVAVIEINTIADVLAIKDEAYDGGTYQVTIPNVTVFAMGDAYFGYDGTGIVQLYQSQTKFELNKVYTITGGLEWYFGIWEIVKSTGVLQENATPQIPTKEEITSLDAQINELIAAGAHNYPTVASGNFEPIYATITGKVVMIEGDSSNYNTYIIDKDADKLVLGTSEKPSNGLLVYYNTLDFAYLKSFAGFEVTMDVVIYTYRSNNLAFAIYYVGGSKGITANLNESQKVDVAVKNTTQPAEVYKADSTIKLPATVDGVAVTWSFKDAAATSNGLVDLTTGKVTLPTGARQAVNLVATFTLGETTKTKEFTIQVGEIPLSTTQEVKDAKSNALKFRIQGTVLGFNGNRQISVADATGAITIYDTADNTVEINKLVGKVVEFIGTRDQYNGLYQVKNVEYKEVTGTVTTPVATDLRDVNVWDVASLMKYQGLPVSLTNVRVKEIIANTYGNVDLVLEDPITLKTIPFFWDSRQPLDDSAFILGLKVGDAVSFNGVLLTWRNSNPSLSISKASQVVAGEIIELTGEQKLALDKATIVVPASTSKDLVLPTNLKNGTTAVWTSSHTAIIANDGKFTDPAEATEVTLTVVLTNGTATETLTFKVNASKEAVLSVIYETAFEAAEGFTAATEYNNVTAKLQGPEDKAWSIIYGTTSTTAPIEGSQSMQLRWYTSAVDKLGSASTSFKTAVKQIQFNGQNTGNLNVNVQYSVDGTTWVSAKLITLTDKSVSYTVDLDVEAEVFVRFEVSLPETNPTGTSRVYIDAVKLLG